MSVLAHVLLALAAVIIAGRLVGRVFARIGQPPVIGEVIAGILLGPSLLGWVSRDLFAFNATEFLLPPQVASHLGIIAQIGVILYMFLIGLELNAGHVQSHARTAAIVSASGIVIPFMLGIGLAWTLYPDLAPAGAPFRGFGLFMGTALAVTAFPVLARILTDRGLSRTHLGSLALSCAAVADVAAWCLLALVIGVVQARIGDAVTVAGLTLVFVALMLLAVRPIAVRIVRRLEGEPLTSGIYAGVFAAVLLAAVATEAIGIHGLFGAFLLGAVLPHDSRLARELDQRLQGIVTTLLLPAFFAYLGLRTEIGLLSGWSDWLLCLSITLVATVGKFGGTLLAARWIGLDWRTSASLGVLMNTHGLMELIVLNVGLELGVISPRLFAMMVIMAIVTTMATAPLLRRLLPREEEPRPRESVRQVVGVPIQAVLRRGRL